jgi:hypothetical protein
MKPKNLSSTLAITRKMAYIFELMPCSGQVLQQRVALTKDWD